MKGFTFGFLIAMTALPHMAVAAVSRVIPGTDTTTTPTVDTNLRANVDASVAPARTTASRTTSSSDNSTRTAVSRNVSRAVSADASEPVTRVANRSAAVSRSQTNTDTRSNLESAVRNVGRSSRTDAASINANPAVRRMGLTLRPSTAEVGGRAIMSSGAQTGSNMASEIRNLQSSRVATIKTRDNTTLDPAAIADAKDRMEQTAALNKSCQEQYNDCMDQFCAVIDANQKRCSCSSNLSKYAKVEKAVKDANTQLNEVAQNIRYVGLSADEISAIMSATEAEQAMTGAADTTENRTLLAQIEQMIKDPTSTSSSSLSSDSFGLLDIDLDFSSSELDDLFTLDFLSGNTGAFSNLRGGDLYNAAKKRCSVIINQCKDVGATAQQITGNYDLAIDKDCIAYEQGLTKMNEALVSNVRSATRMLQKARLAVLQNQNTYSATECIGALETCMTDEMVCGEDYKKCLDPTKKYIDENGNVVLGRDVNYIQRFMTDYNNASVNQSWLASAAITPIDDESCANDGTGKCVVRYLLNKIGTSQKATDSGLCRPVLDKCRAYTYDTRGNYIQYNDIVANYIQRAMVNIRAAQYKIVSDYASTCLTDIATCYNNQVSQLSSWSATAAASSVYNIMRGACRNVALTCGYAVFADNQTSCPPTDANTCIESISEIFYQSLLCPDNSTYVLRTTNQTISENNTDGGWVNKLCRCQDGFVTFNGACLAACENGGIYTSAGVCSEGAACTSITNASDATATEATSDRAFWGGRCACAANMYYYRGKCRRCPSHSEHVAGLAGDLFGGQCQCNSNEGYTASSNKLCCIDTNNYSPTMSCEEYEAATNLNNNNNQL